MADKNNGALLMLAIRSDVGLQLSVTPVRTTNRYLGFGKMVVKILEKIPTIRDEALG